MITRPRQRGARPGPRQPAREARCRPADRPGWLQSPCRKIHQRALKRTFLDLCKLQTGAALEPKPLEAFDKKAAGNLRVVNLGDGVYRAEAVDGTEVANKRAVALARGFMKLCELEIV